MQKCEKEPEVWKNIRERVRNGEKQKDLSLIYNVNHSNINHIIKNRHHKEVL